MKKDYSEFQSNVASWLIWIGFIVVWIIPYIYIPLALVIYWLTVSITDLLEDSHNSKRCSHGIEYAYYEPERCHRCKQELRAEEAKRDAKRKEEIRRREEEIRRREEAEYAEFIRDIKSPEYLKSMNPYDFEEFVCKYFESVGYKVTRTSKSGDQGIDGILEKNGSKTIVQAKRVQKYVGQPIIRDVYGTMIAENADAAFIVTTGKVSQQSRDWIGDKPIHIFTSKDLKGWTEHLKLKIPKSFKVDERSTPFCPKCKAKLVKRRAKKGYKKGKYFWACSRYFATGCSYTREL